MLETARLRLVPWVTEHLLTLVEEPAHFTERFGHPLAEGLRDHFVSGETSPEWVAMLRSSPGADPWAFGFAVVHRESGQVMGSVGFKGPPDADGTVEIAYGIARAFEGQGYATEAAEAGLSFALADPRVRRVVAHTMPQEGASPAILRKLGFAFAGEIVDPVDGPVWRWERRRGEA